MGKMKSRAPEPDSKEPVRSAGAIGAAVSLAVVLVARRLGVDPDVLAGVMVVVAPMVMAELARRRAYAPATVARLLEAKRGEGR